jgi:acetolactate synthase-1/2/3 large subunit
MASLTVREKGDVVPAINEAMSIEGPVLLDFVVEQEENVYPMVAPGAPVREMIRRPSPREK